MRFLLLASVAERTIGIMRCSPVFAPLASPFLLSTAYHVLLALTFTVACGDAENLNEDVSLRGTDNDDDPNGNGACVDCPPNPAPEAPAPATITLPSPGVTPIAPSPAIAPPPGNAPMVVPAPAVDPAPVECIEGVFCGGLCVDVENDQAHCGACNAACPAFAGCKDGVCVCLGGTSCFGECIDDFSANPRHCGQCGNTCAVGETCFDGVCGSPEPTEVCEIGFSQCDGNCVDLRANVDHCGGCFILCAAGQACSAGVCIEVDPDEPPVRGTDGPSYAVTVEPILAMRCTVSCHEPGGLLGGPGGIDQVQQDLTLGTGYRTLTQGRSVELPNMWLVGSSVEDSYLWHKLNDTHLEVGGRGARMPLTGEALNAMELAIVQAWIEGGATP